MLPSRLELKRPEGSSNEAPLAKVNFTTALYVSPVQMIPACSHTGTPLHFHSSTTSGQASVMRLRTRAKVSPRQSPSSLILASICREGKSPPFASFAPLIFFMVAIAFFMVLSAAFAATCVDLMDVLLPVAFTRGCPRHATLQTGPSARRRAPSPAPTNSDIRRVSLRPP